MSIQARVPNRSQDAAATVAASSNAVGKIPPSCVVVVAAEHAVKAGDSRSYGEPLDHVPIDSRGWPVGPGQYRRGWHVLWVGAFAARVRVFAVRPVARAVPGGQG